MILTRKMPCRECPFRTSSAPGWIGPWSVDDILAQATSEVGLACHVDVARLKDLNAGYLKLVRDVHVCVGSLQLCNRSGKRFVVRDLAQMQAAVGVGVNILNVPEFRAHHSEDVRGKNKD